MPELPLAVLFTKSNIAIPVQTEYPQKIAMAVLFDININRGSIIGDNTRYTDFFTEKDLGLDGYTQLRVSLLFP